MHLIIIPLCASESLHRRGVNCWFWLAADLWTLSKWGDGILISNKLRYTEHLVDLMNVFISHAIISSGLDNEYEEDFDLYNNQIKSIKKYLLQFTDNYCCNTDNHYCNNDYLTCFGWRPFLLLTALPEHPKGGLDPEPSWGQWASPWYGVQQV